MQFLQPERNHVSILSQIFMVITTLFILNFVFAAPTYADCSAQPITGCPATQNYICSVTIGGISSTACCHDGPSCTIYKISHSSTGSSTGGSPVNTSGKLNVNPEAGCSNGINTALGCIPYDTEGFSTSLLGFLIGVVGLIALVVMLIATVMIMSGGGNPEQVKKGKELFTGSITGLLFIVFSVTLLRIIAGDIVQLPGFK